MSSSPPKESPGSDSTSSDSPPPSSNSSPPSPPSPSGSSSPPSTPAPSNSSSQSPPPASNDSPSPPPSNKDNDKDNKGSGSPSSGNDKDNKDNDKDNKGSGSPSSGKSSPAPSSDKKSDGSGDGDDSDNGDDNSNGNKNNNNNNNKSPPKSGSSSAPSRHAPSPQSSRSLPSSSNNANALSSSLSQSSSAGQKAVLAGVAAAVAGFVLLFLIIIFFCCRRKKRKADENYYRGDSYGNNGTKYYNNGPNGNWHNNNGPSIDNMVKMQPTHDSGAVSSEHGWQAAPPPPPPMMSSSELSSAGFSGPNHAPLPPPRPAMALGFSQSNFSYDDLKTATNGFSQANLLGQGGFGYVHKGVLPNGKEIAVKSLKANSGQGEREFQAEVEIISRVHHRHLVSLVGYCIAGAQRMLVYEFVPNGTLEYHLRGAGRPTMDWPTRLKIALGSAKGFAYLHEDCHPRIIHRDIKAANILIDFSFEAKVADFGLAKLSSDNNTHVSTRIMGTFGYLAPEYASSGKLTEKSDVYSYGIMILELITGRRPVDVSRDDDDDTLVDWARPILIEVAEGGSYERLVDPRLEDNYNHEEMLRLVHCAAACIRHSARRRPKMSQIVRALEGDVSLDDLNDGTKAAHAMFGSTSSSDYKFTKAGTTSSQEFSSSEFARSIDGNSHDSGQSIRSNRNHNL